MQSRFLIGAPASGGGKTTVTLGLLRAFAQRGLAAQPFKCGPDYIDPLYHAVAAGRESVNLDPFMASKGHICDLFSRFGAEADVCVVEGAMGLFDGYCDARGSSAEVAAMLWMPVVMVINAQAMTYSVAPMLHGYKTFNPEVRIVGAIFNCVTSPAHYAYLARAAREVGVEPLGRLPRATMLNAPSRHLGLSTENIEAFSPNIDAIAEELEKNVDLDRLLELTCAPRLVPAATPATRGASTGAESGAPYGGASGWRGALRIAVARDEAFNFTYRANLDRLAELGEVIYFSPLHDAAPPVDVDLMYLPGGYPEFHADGLSANRSMREAVARYAESGGRVLAECGGMLYLCGSIIAETGAEPLPMCGVLPLTATMEWAKLRIGYREIVFGEGEPADASRWRGHEFHYSHVKGEMPSAARLFSARGVEVTTPHYRYKNVVAGYTHLYWAERDPMELFENQWHA